MWFAPNCCRRVRFYVVDMRLLFVLGIEMLQRAAAQLDLQLRQLMLQGDNGTPTTLTGSRKLSNALSAEILSSMQLYE